MWKSLKRWWHYLATKLRVAHDELADPKVQLEQAIAEAKDQQRRLTEQAASVIANQRQAQARLDRAIGDYEKTKASAGQALVLADRQLRAGDDTKAATFDTAAESYASRLLDLEHEISELQGAVLQATTAAAGAKDAVARNATNLQARLKEKERLLSDLDRAKMQEQINKATAQLSATLGDDVPTFAEVERKIQVRLARATANAELTAAQVASPADESMLEVERAMRSTQAQARLEQLRSSLGLTPTANEPRAIPAPRPSPDPAQGRSRTS